MMITIITAKKNPNLKLNDNNFKKNGWYYDRKIIIIRFYLKIILMINSFINPIFNH